MKEKTQRGAGRICAALKEEGPKALPMFRRLGFGKEIFQFGERKEKGQDILVGRKNNVKNSEFCKETLYKVIYYYF